MDALENATLICQSETKPYTLSFQDQRIAALPFESSVYLPPQVKHPASVPDEIMDWIWWTAFSLLDSHESEGMQMAWIEGGSVTMVSDDYILTIQTLAAEETKQPPGFQLPSVSTEEEIRGENLFTLLEEN